MKKSLLFFASLFIALNSYSQVDTPDIPIFENNGGQFSTSVAIHPQDKNILINSSSGNGDYSLSLDGGQSWEAKANCLENSYPNIAISPSGRQFVTYEDEDGAGVYYSDSLGRFWNKVLIAEAYTTVNYGSNDIFAYSIGVDNSPSSPYQGQVYFGFSDKGVEGSGGHFINRSTNDGKNFHPLHEFTDPFIQNGGYENGNLKMAFGPQGEIYTTFFSRHYMGSSETQYLMFSKSLNGGVDFSDIVPLTGDFNNRNVNLLVDNSEGLNRGNIYLIWADSLNQNINMLKSLDQGETWTEPLAICNNRYGSENTFSPGVCCDPITGFISVVYFCECEEGGQFETHTISSTDGGQTWNDLKVSDVNFGPLNAEVKHLGITALEGKVYPCWSDNRSGDIKTYCSPFWLTSGDKPVNLEAEVNQINGYAFLTWEYDEMDGFESYLVLKDDVEMGSTSNLAFMDTNEELGYYIYGVTAVYADGHHSDTSYIAATYGNPMTVIDPEEVNQYVLPYENTQSVLSVSNSGDVELAYTMAIEVVDIDHLNYCIPEVNNDGNFFINRVIFNEINQESAYDHYADHSNQVAFMQEENTYPLTVHTANESAENLKVYAWIDWNHDGIFNSSNAQDFFSLQSINDTTFKAYITPPSGVESHYVRMRLGVFYESETAINPCGEVIECEYEDYGIVFNPIFELDSYEGFLIPGGGKNHELSFNSYDIEAGNYDYKLVFETNQTSQDDPIVPVHFILQENPFDLQIETSNELFCGQGDYQFLAAVENPEESTFEWRSEPAGFTSDIQNPNFFISEDTRFFVKVTHGEEISVAEKMVLLLEKPQVSLGYDQEHCSIQEVILENYASNPEEVTYSWNSGEVGESIQVDFGSTIMSADSISQHICTALTPSGCQAADTVAIKWLNCVGLEEISSNGFQIYPNPANTQISLDVSAVFETQVSIRLYQVQGQLIFSEDNQDSKTIHSYDIHQLPEGIYTFVVIGDTHISQKKIVISR